MSEQMNGVEARIMKPVDARNLRVDMTIRNLRERIIRLGGSPVSGGVVALKSQLHELMKKGAH